jgi:sirohydrochlorin ferrochelatase
MKVGIAIFAHGSAVESANEAVRGIVRQFAARGACDLVETSFLELGQPDLPAAVERLVERGAGRVIVIPYFLTPGKHLRRDLPRIVDEIAQAHPGLEIVVTPPLDGHPALADILLDRAKDAL